MKLVDYLGLPRPENPDEVATTLLRGLSEAAATGRAEPLERMRRVTDVARLLQDHDWSTMTVSHRGRVPAPVIELGDILELTLYKGQSEQGGDIVIDSARQRPISRGATRLFGFDFPELAARLNAGEAAGLALSPEYVPLPLPLSAFEKLVNRDLTPENFLEVVTHHTTSLHMAAAATGLDPESVASLAPHIKDLRGDSPERLAALLRRFQLRDGHIFLKGGEASRDAWRNAVGADPMDTGAFLKALTKSRNEFVLDLILAGEFDAGQDVLVPGGRETLARMLQVRVPRKQRFVTDLVQIFDRREAAGERLRAHLVDNLGMIIALTEELGPKVPLHYANDSRRVEKVFEELGYDLVRSRGKLHLEAIKDPRAAKRRKAVWALGLNLVDMTRRLERGEQVVLTIPWEAVPSPISESEWVRWIGVNSDPIRRFRLLFRVPAHTDILLAYAQLGEADIDGLGLRDRTLSPTAALRLKHHASTFRLDAEGKLAVPGGPAAMALWQSAVGVSPSAPKEFVATMLDAPSDGPLRLWSATCFLPPPAQRLLLFGEGLNQEAAAKLRRRIAGALALPELPTQATERAAAASSELATLFEGLLSENTPDANGEADTETIVDRLLGELFANAEGRSAIEGGAPGVEPLRLRSLRGFLHGRGQKALASTSRRHRIRHVLSEEPRRLSALGDLALCAPDAVDSYLVATDAIAAIRNLRAREALLLQLQGGVELLRRMARSRSIDDAALERLFKSWMEVHEGATHPRMTTMGVLFWLSELSEALPPGAEGAPGRGPIEARLLAAIVPARDPQLFSFQSLDYRGERGRQMAAGITRHLEDHEVPRIDDLVAFARAAAQLEHAIDATDRDLASASITQFADALEALPTWKPHIRGHDENVATFVTQPRRARIISVLRSIAEDPGPGALRRFRTRLEAGPPFLHFASRHLFVGLVYSAAAGEYENTLLEEPSFPQRHTLSNLMDHDRTRGFRGETAWERSRVVPNRESVIGVRLSGCLHDAPWLLSAFHRIPESRWNDGGLGHPLHRRLLVHANAKSRWEHLENLDTELIHLAIRAGRALEASAAPAASEHVRLRIPARRAKGDGGNTAVVETGHHFLLGLSAVTGDEFGPALDQSVEPAVLEDLRAAVSALGEDRAREVARLATSVVPDGHPGLWGRMWPPRGLLVARARGGVLRTRAFLELRFRVLDYLGQRRLPGLVGRDVLERSLVAADALVEFDNPYDWSTWIDALQVIDESFLDERVRECLRRGNYSAQFS